MKRIVLVSFVALGSVMLLVALFWNSLRPYFGFETEAEKLTKVLEHDKEILSSRSADERDVYAALVRLGDRGSLASKQEALRRLDDPSLQVKKGAAEALGYFAEDADARDGLEKMMNDKNEEVRVDVLKAISIRGGAGRGAFLNKVYSQLKSPTELEHEAYLRGLLRVGSDSDRKKGGDALIALYNKTSNARVKFDALSDLTTHLSRDPRVLDVIQNDAIHSKDPNLQSQAIRHIAAIRDRKMAKVFESLLNSPSAEVRMTVALALPIACPDSRYLFAETLATKDAEEKIRIEAIKQVGHLGGDEGKNMLERLLKSELLKDPERATAKTALREVEKNMGKADICKW